MAERIHEHISTKEALGAICHNGRRSARRTLRKIWKPIAVGTGIGLGVMGLGYYKNRKQQIPDPGEFEPMDEIEDFESERIDIEGEDE